MGRVFSVKPFSPEPVSQILAGAILVKFRDIEPRITLQLSLSKFLSVMEEKEEDMTNLIAEGSSKYSSSCNSSDNELPGERIARIHGRGRAQGYRVPS